MSVDSSLVDRIVRGVLHGLEEGPNRLGAAGGAGLVAPPAEGETKLADAVITAEVLSQHVPAGASTIAISARAILTPAALDVVRLRRLTIQRAAPMPAASAAQTTKRLAIVVRATPVLERLLRDHAGEWRRELLGCPEEAARLATSGICRGDADLVMVFAAEHHRAACLANRHERIKAVAVASLDELREAREQLRVNVICLDPSNRGDFEMRRWLNAAGEGR